MIDNEGHLEKLKKLHSLFVECDITIQSYGEEVNILIDGNIAVSGDSDGVIDDSIVRSELYRQIKETCK